VNGIDILNDLERLYADQQDIVLLFRKIHNMGDDDFRALYNHMASLEKPNVLEKHLIFFILHDAMNPCRQSLTAAEIEEGSVYRLITIGKAKAGQKITRKTPRVFIILYSLRPCRREQNASASRQPRKKQIPGRILRWLTRGVNTPRRRNPLKTYKIYYLAKNKTPPPRGRFFEQIYLTFFDNLGNNIRF